MFAVGFYPLVVATLCFVRQLFAEQCLGRMPESSQRVAWIEGSDPGIPKP